MKIRISPINGHADQIKEYLGSAISGSSISFDGTAKQDYDVVAHIEEDVHSPVLALVGRNIIQAGGGRVRVTSANPSLSWEGGGGDGW